MDTPKDTETVDNLIKENPKPEHKSPSRLMLIVGGIMLLFIGLVIGYYFSQKSQYVAIPQTTPSPILSPEASDEMEGWKTFVSKYNNISFEYPSGYILEDRDNYTSLLSPLDPTPRKGYAISDKELKIEVVVFESDSSDSLGKWVLEEKSKTEESIEEIGTTKIDGVEAKILKTTGMGIVKVYLAIHNTKRYMILKYPFATSLDAEFNQILSTFEFVE